jgi:hypothetical protein
MHGYRVLKSTVAQDVQEDLPIGLGNEHRLAVVSALDDVVRISGYGQSR